MKKIIFVVIIAVMALISFEAKATCPPGFTEGTITFSNTCGDNSCADAFWYIHFCYQCQGSAGGSSVVTIKNVQAEFRYWAPKPDHPNCYVTYLNEPLMNMVYDQIVAYVFTMCNPAKPCVETDYTSVRFEYPLCRYTYNQVFQEHTWDPVTYLTIEGYCTDPNGLKCVTYKAYCTDYSTVPPTIRIKNVIPPPPHYTEGEQCTPKASVQIPPAGKTYFEAWSTECYDIGETCN